MANAGVRGRPVAPLVLSGQEREYLEQVRRHRVARSLSERCRVIVRCADGLASKDVAAELGLHEHTVGKWRRRFLKDRCDGLLDEVRPGRPRIIDDDQVAAVIERTLRTTPVDATHWSIRSMAAEIGFSHTTIRRMWVAFGLQPHRSQTFKLSNDPLFVDKVRAIVGLYLSPPNRALVLSIDEKSQIQALDREQPLLPMIWRTRTSHAQLRAAWYNLAALDVASGFVIGKCYKRHRAAEFLNFLKEIDAQVAEGLDIHIVMDNYATHNGPRAPWIFASAPSALTETRPTGGGPTKSGRALSSPHARGVGEHDGQVDHLGRRIDRVVCTVAISCLPSILRLSAHRLHQEACSPLSRIIFAATRQ
jgi:transposase